MARKPSMPKMPKLPEKFPKHVTEGTQMDYTDSSLAFPKTKKKPKKKWGKG